MIRALLSQMRALRPHDGLCKDDPTIAVSLLIPVRRAESVLRGTVAATHAFLQQRCAADFEIILVPNSAPQEVDHSAALCHDLAEQYPQVRVCPHEGAHGKGAALRTGVRASRGKFLLFIDADMPYDLEFFERALVQLEAGYDYVTGNRRLPTSHINVPAGMIWLIFRRYQLGRLFNVLARSVLPISTGDTQAGIKAMSRRAAQEVFDQLTCPGFYFDLEVHLLVHAGAFRQTELPVMLRIDSEKSTVRVLQESVLAGYWLSRFWWHSATGRFRPRRDSTRDAELPLTSQTSGNVGPPE